MLSKVPVRPYEKMVNSGAEYMFLEYIWLIPKGKRHWPVHVEVKNKVSGKFKRLLTLT